MATSLVTLLGLGMLAQTYGGVIQFGLMIDKVVRRPPIFSYAFYGCHCGAGGSGWPVDNIDWCCHIHDCCFDSISSRRCYPHWVLYRYDYIDGDITCLDNQLDGCARRACECDREAVLCFKRHNATYSPSNNFYPKSTRCDELQPPCDLSPLTWN
ncbi:phospholipase A2-like [Aquarana catesbeiana]|uniref:phospholipase A2-like n=1 Tax=Aquarana catesbeiana TaxID=8400 RepID=UPI003CCA076D